MNNQIFKNLFCKNQSEVFFKKIHQNYSQNLLNKRINKMINKLLLKMRNKKN